MNNPDDQSLKGYKITQCLFAFPKNIFMRTFLMCFPLCYVGFMNSSPRQTEDRKSVASNEILEAHKL